MVKDRMESFIRKRRQSFSKSSSKMNQGEMTWKSLSLMTLLDMAKQVKLYLSEYVNQMFLN